MNKEYCERCYHYERQVADFQTHLNLLQDAVFALGEQVADQRGLRVQLKAALDNLKTAKELYQWHKRKGSEHAHSDRAAMYQQIA